MNGVITTTTSHGFEYGDVVTFEQPSGTGLSGFVDGRQYTVTKPVTSTGFTLTEIGTTPAGDATETHRIKPKEVTTSTGAGVKFHLAIIAGSPTTTVSGSTTALNSLTNKD